MLLCHAHTPSLSARTRCCIALTHVQSLQERVAVYAHSRTPVRSKDTLLCKLVCCKTLCRNHACPLTARARYLVILSRLFAANRCHTHTRSFATRRCYVALTHVCSFKIVVCHTHTCTRPFAARCCGKLTHVCAVHIVVALSTLKHVRYKARCAALAHVVAKHCCVTLSHICSRHDHCCVALTSPTGAAASHSNMSVRCCVALLHICSLDGHCWVVLKRSP
jgi:hypothetical protein